jgi:hypothetical protein
MRHLSDGDRAAWLLGAAAALATVGVAILLLMSAGGRALFEFSAGPPELLDEGEVIDAWIDLDKPSYLQGDIVRYRIRIVWNEDAVTPRLDAFDTSVSFYPLEKLAVQSAERGLRGALREYSADFILQAVNVEAPSSYRLDTVTVYFSRASDGHAEVHALRANPPAVHFGEYFAPDVADITLLPYKGSMDEARGLRGGLMAGLGLMLLVLVAALLWLRSRRRPAASLSPAEALWREFEALRHGAGDARQRLLAFERVFTRVLELCAGMTPAQFWAARDLESADAGADLEAARQAFKAAYRPEGPADAELASVIESIDGLLGPLVQEEQLRREMQASAADRLRSQPRLLAASAAPGLAGLVALVLAAQPAAWVSDDVSAYNDAVELLETGDNLQAAYDAFTALTEGAEDLRVKAASFYNLGELLVDPRMNRISRERFENFRQAIFVPDVTLSRMLHDMEMDAEFELVTLLTELTRRYVQAEQAMRAAVRLVPEDGDTRRNLEILAKIRRAIARSLASMVQQGEEGTGSQELLSQSMIDLQLLMEAELPEDFAKQDEGKDDRAYFIMEKF